MTLFSRGCLEAEKPLRGAPTWLAGSLPFATATTALRRQGMAQEGITGLRPPRARQEGSPENRRAESGKRQYVPFGAIVRGLWLVPSAAAVALVIKHGIRQRGVLVFRGLRRGLHRVWRRCPTALFCRSGQRGPQKIGDRRETTRKLSHFTKCATLWSRTPFRDGVFCHRIRPKAKGGARFQKGPKGPAKGVGSYPFCRSEPPPIGQNVQRNRLNQATR